MDALLTAFLLAVWAILTWYGERTNQFDDEV